PSTRLPRRGRRRPRPWNSEMRGVHCSWSVHRFGEEKMAFHRVGQPLERDFFDGRAWRLERVLRLALIRFDERLHSVDVEAREQEDFLDDHRVTVADGAPYLVFGHVLKFRVGEHGALPYAECLRVARLTAPRLTPTDAPIARCGRFSSHF